MRELLNHLSHQPTVSRLAHSKEASLKINAGEKTIRLFSIQNEVCHIYATSVVVRAGVEPALSKFKVWCSAIKLPDNKKPDLVGAGSLFCLVKVLHFTQQKTGPLVGGVRAGAAERRRKSLFRWAFYIADAQMYTKILKQKAPTG